MTLRFAQPRESLPCPYCDEPHLEDVAVCPTTHQAILLDHKYRLKKLLGEGSFGLVWDARNIDTQKEVAIKSLRVEVVSDPAVLGRFFWEATAAGRIHNPHICDVLDLVKKSVHGPYIVLERLTGRSLESLLEEQGRLAPEKIVFLLRQALVGLEAVHRAGIIHRDLKPENIFLHEPDDGRTVVKLLDFGISKFALPSGGGKSRTAADMFMGTPAYTSPEQARGAAAVDLRTDIWAVGAILYKGLTGALPFDGPDIPSLLTAILHTPHRPLTQLAPQVPAGLAAIVDRCLSKRREDRFDTCAELSAALEPYEQLQYARTALEQRHVFHAPSSPAPLELTALAATAAPRDLTAATGAAAPAELGELVVLGHHAADRRWLDLLKEHLRLHRGAARLRTWDTGDTEPGAGRDAALQAAFARARAVVLLVSPGFMADEFVPGAQLYAMTLMAQARGLPILWFAVREVAAAGTDLDDFRAIGTRPLDRLPFTEADRALEALCDPIVASVGGVDPTPTGSSGDPGRDLAARLEQARARRSRLEAQGEDTRAVIEEINGLRRALRSGRPLHHGDILDDRFVVLEQIGAGGFATVWRALDEKSGAAVAIKVLHAQHAHNPERRERFFRGARIMAQLDHPNIVKILEPWASDGEYEYFVMQYVSGGTLRDAVVAGKLSPGRRVEALLAVADALATAHHRGIVHRDVKPTNILIADDGTPYLSDFDLVRAEDTTGGTAGGLGTVIYAAPEMMERAAEADARADVYGLGMTLAFLFYEKDLTMEVIRNTDRMIGELRTSEAVRMVIRTAITWNREHRFRSAAEFHSALQAAVTRRESVPPTTRAAATQIGRPTAPPPAPARSPATSTAIPEVSLDSSPGPTVTPPAPTGLGLEAPDGPRTAGTIEAAFAALQAEAADESPTRAAFAALEAEPPPPPPPSPAPPPASPDPRSEPSLARRFAQIAIDAEIQGERAVRAVFDSLEVHEDTRPLSASARPLTAAPHDDQTLPDTPPRLSPRTVVPIALGVGALLVLIYVLAL